MKSAIGGRHFRRFGLLALAAFSLLAFSCKNAALEPSGELRVSARSDGESMLDFARRFQDLRLIPGDGGEADLVFERDGSSAVLGLKAGILPPGGRKPAGTIRPLRPFKGAGSAAFPVVPVEATWYGIWYDADRLSALGVEPPKDLAGLRAAAASAARSGIRPIALGGGRGRSLALWFAYADIRLNGADAYAQRIAGKRRFDDGQMIRAARFAFGLFPADTSAGGAGAADTPGDPAAAAGTAADSAVGAPAAGSGNASSSGAWEELIDGAALFCLEDSSAADRIPAGRNIHFVPVPEFRAFPAFWLKRGELSVVSAFSVPASSRSPESAAAFAWSYALERSQDAAVGGSSVPAFLESAEIRTRPGAAVLRAAARVMPPLDRALSPQASYDAMRLFAEAARVPASRDAELFCARLERLREGSR